MLQSGSGTPGRGAAATPERGKQIESGRMGMVCRWGMVREGGGVGGLRGGGGTGGGGCLKCGEICQSLFQSSLKLLSAGERVLICPPGREEGGRLGRREPQAGAARTSVGVRSRSSSRSPVIIPNCACWGPASVPAERHTIWAPAQICGELSC